MHRMKIGLAAAGILLVVTFGVFVAVTNALKASATTDVEQRLTRAERAFAEVGRLRAVDAAMQAFERAKRPSVVAVFDKTDETARRQAAFTECEALNAGLQKENRKAAIVAVLDATGKVIARDLNPEVMWRDDLKARFPAVAAALKGEPVKDVWTLDGRMNQVALAPISRGDGSILGALLIGHVVSAKRAQETHDALGTEIGYFHGGKMHVSSFGSTGDGEKEDVGKTQALGNLAFGTDKLAEQALQKGSATGLVHTTVEGRNYVALAAPLGGNFADKTSGVVLVASLSDALDGVQGTGMYVLIFGLVAILVALGAAVLTAKRFISPLDKVELGVAEIINGNIDYTFRPVGPDFEGLSNALNVMLARLLGREEPNEDAVEDEEEEGAKKTWRAEQMNIDEGDGAAAAGAAALGQEGEAAYYPRLFNEYVSSLRSMGKPAEGVSVPAFMAKLRLAEAGLKQKWSCRMVRFALAARGNDIVFRAVKID
jgi:hypothetical protein